VRIAQVVAAGSPVEERVSRSTLVAYSLPRVGTGFLVILILIYLMKFSTDVLLLPPAVVGVVFGLTRIWDAIADPIAGYWSDRTRTRLGRRRPWLLASALPLALFNVMLWSPPAALGEGALVAWFSVALFGLYTAMSIFSIPHFALGAEMSRDYSERTRVFGARYLGFGIGTLVLLPTALFLLTRASDPRATAFWIACAASAFTGVAIAASVVVLRERAEYATRGPRNPVAAFADVWHNPHARILLLVYFIEHLGQGAMSVLGPYVMQYIVGEPELLALLIPAFAVPSILSIPVWIRLGRRWGKRELWLAAMLMNTVAFGSFFLVGLVPLPILAGFAMLAGFAGGCGQIIAPSIKADVIDWDELRTGERKEGAYFATWEFVERSSGAVVAMLAGFALQLVGFQPNAPQSEETKFAMRAMMGLLPGVFYAAGIAIFWRFRLDAAEHARIRAELDARRVGVGRAQP
jgi:GPH family glycoside/pentoside/hexuronide:cation symporter